VMNVWSSDKNVSKEHLK